MHFKTYSVQVLEPYCEKTYLWCFQQGKTWAHACAVTEYAWITDLHTRGIIF